MAQILCDVHEDDEILNDESNNISNDPILRLFDMNHINDRQCISELLEIDPEQIPLDKNGKCVIHGVVRSIPYETLPEKCTGIIVNIFANPVNKLGNCTKYGNDDNTYNTYPILFKILPRSRSVCIIHNSNSNSISDKISRFHNFGFSKFLGKTSDEEDEEVDIKNDGLFTIGNYSEEIRYVLTKKENGKMVAFTMFQFQNINYFFGGSKNVHIIVNEQLRKYELSGELIADIFKIWLRKWNDLNLEQREQLRELMMNGYTLCGEYNDGLHIVPLKNNTHTIIFFGIVKRVIITDKLCEDAVTILEQLRKFGCDVVEYEIIDKNEIENVRKVVRYKTNCEGYVIHKQEKVENKWHTVSLEKYKTWWYVIIRMLREFIKNGIKNGWGNSWQQRFNKRNDEYMHLPENFKNSWKMLTRDFIEYFILKSYQKGDIGFMNGATGMARIWNNFINETKINDDLLTLNYKSIENISERIGYDPAKIIKDFEELLKLKQKELEEEKKNGWEVVLNRKNRKNTLSEIELINLKIKTLIERIEYEKQKANRQNELLKNEFNEDQKCDKVLIVLQGTLGLGKTTLGNYIAELLNKHNIKAKTLEQDTFVPKHGFEKAGKICFSVFKSLLKSAKVIILQRNNANQSQYLKYIEAAKHAEFTVIFFSPSEVKNSKYKYLLALTCMQSVLNRKNHIISNLTSLDKQLLFVLIFLSQLEVPDERNNNVDYIFDINYLDETKMDNIDKNIITTEGIEPQFNWYLNYYNNVCTYNWQTVPRDVKEVTEALKLTSVDYQQLRLPLDIIANIVVDKILNILNTNINTNKNLIKYISVTFDKMTKNQLINKIEELGLTEIFASYPNKFLSHITLVYCVSNQYDQKLYEELIGMENREILFEITNIIHAEKTLMVFECNLAENLRLCESKIPHITIATAENIQPVKSLDIVMNKAQHHIYPVSELLLSGKISFKY